MDMWKRYTRPNPADPLGRDDWFTIRTEDGTDGRLTLVLVDWVCGARPDVTRAVMDAQTAEDVAEETGAGLLAEGWTLELAECPV
ncbi:hypothetical protein CPT_Shaeky_052 [Streptomyces phage Shaeky]|uniref:Uncharacterized protein n=1 Tax=Streptomyces phage Shaeky TaxID=2767586 RepID=A0A873WE37_9CAUD|nr:hypothetical protein CPT_Shaeky_052 [Streptomyces phage Shaeky]